MDGSLQPFLHRGERLSSMGIEGQKDEQQALLQNYFHIKTKSIQLFGVFHVPDRKELSSGMHCLCLLIYPALPA